MAKIDLLPLRDAAARARAARLELGTAIDAAHDAGATVEAITREVAGFASKPLVREYLRARELARRAAAVLHEAGLDKSVGAFPPAGLFARDDTHGSPRTALLVRRHPPGDLDDAATLTDRTLTALRLAGITADPLPGDRQAHDSLLHGAGLALRNLTRDELIRAQNPTHTGGKQ